MPPDPPPPSSLTTKQSQSNPSSASPRYFYDSPPSQAMIPSSSVRSFPPSYPSPPTGPYHMSGAGGYYPIPPQVPVHAPFLPSSSLWQSSRQFVFSLFFVGVVLQAPQASPPSYEARRMSMAPRGAQPVTPTSPYMSPGYAPMPNTAYGYGNQVNTPVHKHHRTDFFQGGWAETNFPR